MRDEEEKFTDFRLSIVRTDNGFILSSRSGVEENEWVIEDKEDDLQSKEQLLWNVLEFFALCGGQYDKERVVVKREPGDKYKGDETK